MNDAGNGLPAELAELLEVTTVDQLLTLFDGHVEHAHRPLTPGAPLPVRRLVLVSRTWVADPDVDDAPL